MSASFVAFSNETIFWWIFLIKTHDSTLYSNAAVDRETRHSWIGIYLFIFTWGCGCYCLVLRPIPTTDWNPSVNNSVIKPCRYSQYRERQAWRQTRWLRWRWTRLRTCQSPGRRSAECGSRRSQTRPCNCRRQCRSTRRSRSGSRWRALGRERQWLWEKDLYGLMRDKLLQGQYIFKWCDIKSFLAIRDLLAGKSTSMCAAGKSLVG